MSITRLLVPTFEQLLSALSGWLAKAGEQLPAADAEALLAARLAPDMFPLSTQVRFACVQAYEAVARLTGKEMSASVATLLEEGRSGGDRPGSLAEARARIAETLAMLGRLAPGALDVAPDAPLEHALPNGMIFDLTAERYARDWTLAQFYFHIMTAYAILRSRQVALGKADYMPHLLPALRAGTMPTG